MRWLAEFSRRPRECRNACAFALLFFLLLIIPASAATRVWGFYGWGDNAFGSSKGIDEIAVQARQIPGISFVHIFNYWQTQNAANEIMAAPSTDKIVLYGYSCGANAITNFFNIPRQMNIAGIQESIYCGGYPIANNVRYAQETYAGCLLTLGFGCKKYQPASGYTGQIKLIRRPDLHGRADDDPDAQADVLSVIAGTAGARKYGAVKGWHVQEVVRYHGQRP